MFLGNHESSPGVKFVIYDANHQRHGWRGPAQNFPDSALAAELLETNRWCHLAAVSGKDGMKLYYNGELVGRLGYTSSFAAIRQPITNYLGKSSWSNDTDFRGQMSEVRVWKVARTEAQIREAMTKNLTGQEPNLVGLWSFKDGTARDLSPNSHHGKLIGRAKVIPALRPAGESQPVTLETVLQLDGASEYFQPLDSGDG